jgi:GT2 family glycosyltransferase
MKKSTVSENRGVTVVEADIAAIFDLNWYSQNGEDALSLTNISPLQHYLSIGAGEGRDPHPLFDTDWYLARNEDVAKQGVNPLLHFVEYGWREGRDPHPLFSLQWYLENNPDVAAVGVNPLVHFLTFGAAEGRSPHPAFDTKWYLKKYSDLPVGANPLVHYLTFRGDLLRQPSSEIDLVEFAKIYPEIKVADDHELVSFVAYSSRLREWQDKSDTQFLAKSQFAKFRFRDSTNVVDGVTEWASYDRLSQKIALLESKRSEKYSPEHLAQIECAVGFESKFAESIRFDLKESPTVSVIIPAFNKANLTLVCLKALMDGAGSVDFEVIVADDASTESACHAIKKIAGLTYLENPENLGFLRNCNRAVERASGRFLLFLNNDTQIQPGLIDHLVAAHAPGVGIVGPKITYPSGVLQEAGARIRLDGSSVLIGHGASARDPRYNYARDVEYVSGACILIERELFLALDRFDERYCPAYYEDVDLCFKVRDRGLRVVYEPKATVSHVLSATMSEISSEFKLRQAAINGQKFVEKWANRISDDNTVRTVAFYLPQFHSIKENDMWWGPGFTEWTNVSKALPNYLGHDQPRLPADLGHYDLSDAQTFVKQIELAKRYGLSGFCFYYYWFNGRRILERPTELYLQQKSLDFPFCICWANENWTRRWDGQENDVLLRQDYSEDNDRLIILDMMRFMRDPRYIKIDNKPVVVLYRWDLLPDIRETARIWREECRRQAIGEIYLVAVDSFNLATKLRHVDDIGFDATIGFPPHDVASPSPKDVEIVNVDFEGFVDDYEAVAARSISEMPLRPFTHFPGVAPGWDNTARKQHASYTLDASSPGAFSAWLERALEASRNFNAPSKRVTFINAWNEWGEGAYLEPDQRFGHAYLTAMRRALDANKFNQSN